MKDTTISFIPAQPGFTLLVAIPSSGSGKKDWIAVEEHPIIAWSVAHEGEADLAAWATPVCAGDTDWDKGVVTCDPLGNFFIPGDRSFDTKDDAIKFLVDQDN